MTVISWVNLNLKSVKFLFCSVYLYRKRYNKNAAFEHSDEHKSISTVVFGEFYREVGLPFSILKLYLHGDL